MASMAVTDRSVKRVQTLVHEYATIHEKGTTVYTPSNIEELASEMTKQELTTALVQIAYLTQEYRK